MFMKFKYVCKFGKKTMDSKMFKNLKKVDEFEKKHIYKNHKFEKKVHGSKNCL